MELKLYNSLTNKIEEFNPSNEDNITMYVCGPTVYNYIHIGNARPVVFYDMVKRYLEFCGHKVTYASNITDIDDKIINRAIEENKTEKEVATFYENAYFKNCEFLNAKRPDIVPHATDYINDMINSIDEMIQNGFAYEVDGNVYFRISKVKDYGILSNQELSDLNEGARIDVDSNKENPLDFTLWKKTDKGIKWDSPFGAGRPGWHTECVVMNHRNFGKSIDIHGGGMDLKFPHHENEIAQSKALYNNSLANYWLHVGRVDLRGVKMSKSLGNVIYVNDLKTKKDAMVLRMLLLFSPYRSNINYSDELVSQYNKIYDKWSRSLKQTYYYAQANNLPLNEYDESYINKFKEYMNDDFNVQNVLMLLDDIIKNINLSFRQKDYIKLGVVVATMLKLLDVLGIDLDLVNLSVEQKTNYLAWQEARDNKDFATADLYRDLLIKDNIL